MTITRMSGSWERGLGLAKLPVTITIFAACQRTHRFLGV